MLKMYDGISVGTVQRRRRAPVERFLALKVELPAKEFHKEVHQLTQSAQAQLQMLRVAAGILQDFVNNMAQAWITDKTRDKA